MSIALVQQRLHPPNAQASFTSDCVKNVAVALLKELVVCVPLGLAVASLVQTASGVSLITGAMLVQIAVSLVFHSLATLISQKKKGRAEETLSLFQWITGFNVAIFTGCNAQTLLHESGHALAALCVYKNGRPRIEIYPFVGGITRYYKGSLTPFGKKIGAAASTCLITASGPAITLLVSLTLFTIGLAIQKTHPRLAKYLVSWGVVDFIEHAGYACSAMREKPSKLSHDFVHLSLFGLHPIAASVAIVAIPALIWVGITWYQQEKPATPLLP